uniref:NADH-ubiquinone oxidoreductase chain 6 n=1 Tax=Brachymna tenuis TaxID=2575665 RepID=A0A4D6X2S7_9HEMI|nr:NADH dehydrogenase subunit 6 [Brachymna tenuis]QCI09271.1 NADH dehydrogenase subunit 6 [Brachymna tenuis]
MNLLMTMMITLSISLMMMNHPLSMGLILIMQTMIVSMIIGYMMETFFFSYIIIIIMMSGMLVLFIYMASVASNEKFNLSMKLMIMLSPIMMLSMIILSKYNINYYNMESNNEIISLIKMFNSITAQLTMIMILYLLLTMIVVSNIAKVTEGPLRMKNYE